MRDNRLIVETLINKMFEIAGHSVTFNDILSREDDWYCQWTMTEDQNKEWIEWGIKHLRKDGKMVQVLAQREMAMINLSYGLKIKNT